MQVNKCVNPKQLLRYIIDEFIGATKSVKPEESSGLSRVVVPTLEILREAVEDVEEDKIGWDSIVTAVTIIINAYIISVLYDNAPRTCLETLIDWLRTSMGTGLESYTKMIARQLGIPIEG